MITCAIIIVCTNGDIRLVGGTNPREGRVEVCANNTWGTVCDDSWGTPDATVVCRQAGFSTMGAVALGSATFGQGTGPIVLDDVGCTGTENRLVQCAAITQHNCAHSEDAGVRCQECKPLLYTAVLIWWASYLIFLILLVQCETGDLRLVNGTSTSSSLTEGRVEYCISGVWGTVCDTAWNVNAASVVCRQLGFSGFRKCACRLILNPLAGQWCITF